MKYVNVSNYSTLQLKKSNQKREYFMDYQLMYLTLKTVYLIFKFRFGQTFNLFNGCSPQMSKITKEMLCNTLSCGFSFSPSN